jgi:hypothetical protein
MHVQNLHQEKTRYVKPIKKKFKTENIGTFKDRNFNFNISGRCEFFGPF